MTNQATIPVIATKPVKPFFGRPRATSQRWIAMVDGENFPVFAYGRTERAAYARLVRQILVGA